MNYLAHLFLSGDNSELMVGNLMEDFIVGRIEHPRNQFIPENIKKGIQLHRIIDTFTDSHLAVKPCKSILYEKYHKYSSVLIDIFFDHFLAIHWKKFSTENFDSFRTRVYQNFNQYYHILPQRMKPMIDSMQRHDWLNNYGELWGIEKSLINISKRTKFDSKMEYGIQELKDNFDFFQHHFLIFFPELQAICQTYIESHNFTFHYSKI